MSFISTLSSGEQQAVAVISDLQSRIVSEFARTSPDSSRTPLRKTIVQLARQSTNGLQYKLESIFRQAWQDGVERASKELKIDNDSLLNPDVEQNIHTAIDRTDSLVAQIGSDISILSSRYGTDTSLQDIVQLVDDKFEEYKQRAAGIINYELKVVEANAKAKRVTEAHQEFKKQLQNKNAPAKAKVKASKGLVPLTMKEWSHDGSGVPRPGHLALHGKAVVEDAAFHLRGKDGEVYHPQRPHDSAALPPGEIINCGCNDYPYVVWVTPNQERQIREMSASGGISNWRSVIKGLPK